MPRFFLRLVACLALASATACATAGDPELRVIGVDQATAHDVVFVQVTNPASTTMRLTKLQYVFEAAGTRVSAGELALQRDVPAGAAVIVEVPLDRPATKPMKLEGKLTAELDQIVRIFQVSAQIAPH
jgi:LEA14-like dessication related protein